MIWLLFGLCCYMYAGCVILTVFLLSDFSWKSDHDLSENTLLNKVTIIIYGKKIPYKTITLITRLLQWTVFHCCAL